MVGIKLKTSLITQSVGIFLSLALVGLTLSIAIPNRRDTPYYHMNGQEDYQAFVWIGENVDKSYSRAILDPWKATAFVALTGKYVYARTHNAPSPTTREASAFLSGGSTDTDFLRENDISIIYTPGDCNNPDLIEVRENVYLLEEGEQQK
ncbi:hypothetical protein ACFLWB_03145 [Chloroflexota bacterium]